jgi:hypothetical protein
VFDRDATERDVFSIAGAAYARGSLADERKLHLDVEVGGLARDARAEYQHGMLDARDFDEEGDLAAPRGVRPRVTR